MWIYPLAILLIVLAFLLGYRWGRNAGYLEALLEVLSNFGAKKER